MTNGTKNLALYCDFENIALGVRDAQLRHGLRSRKSSSDCWSKATSWSRKAYCDWDRYKDF